MVMILGEKRYYCQDIIHEYTVHFIFNLMLFCYLSRRVWQNGREEELPHLCVATITPDMLGVFERFVEWKETQNAKNRQWRRIYLHEIRNISEDRRNSTRANYTKDTWTERCGTELSLKCQDRCYLMLNCRINLYGCVPESCKKPFEKQKPKVNNLRVFGCDAYVHIPNMSTFQKTSEENWTQKPRNVYFWGTATLYDPEK